MPSEVSMPAEPTKAVEARLDGDTLHLWMFGYFGTDWYGDGSMIDAAAVARMLSQYKEVTTIRSHMSSGGGDPFHGMAIHGLLTSHGAKLEAVIYGLVASAATLPLMAAQSITMTETGLLMLHEMRWGTFGTESEQQAALDATKRVNNQAAALYAAKSKMKVEDVRALMHSETWMTADEAKAKGFVDQIATGPAMAASVNASQFENVPERIKPLLKSLHDRKASMTQSTTPAPAPSPAVAPATPATGQAPAAQAGAAPAMAAPAASAAPVAAPVAAVPATAAAPAAPATDPVMAAVQRASEITSACVMAGKAEMASKWIENPAMSVADVRNQLFALMCGERQPIASAAPGGDQKPADPNAKYIAEFKANETMYAEMGVTQDHYIKTRRVDDGLDKITLGRPN